MKRNKFCAIADAFGEPVDIFTRERPVKSGTVYHVKVTNGEDKGRVGLLDGFDWETIWIVFDDGTRRKFDFKNVEACDSDGNVDATVTDMLGQKLAVEQIVAYAASAGEGKVAMEIGEITKITDAGNLMVVTRVVDGVPVKRVGKPRRVDPIKAIKLPISEEILVFALLSDYDSIKPEV